MNIKIVNKSDNPLPSYETIHSAGVDLRADLRNIVGAYYKDDKPFTMIKPGQTVLIPTGLHIQLPVGYEAQIRPRSGLALKYGITVLNTPGTIDSDFTGNVGIILINHSGVPFKVTHGDRIAQMVINKVERAEFIEVESLDATERGDGGFGHTGVK